MQANTPLEWILGHLYHLTWPTVVVLVWRCVRFFSKIEAIFEKKSTQFDELHMAVTNHLTHAIPDAAEKVRLELVTHDQHEDAGFREVATAIDKMGDRLVADGHETRETIRSHFAQGGK